MTLLATVAWMLPRFSSRRSVKFCSARRANVHPLQSQLRARSASVFGAFGPGAAVAAGLCDVNERISAIIRAVGKTLRCQIRYSSALAMQIAVIARCLNTDGHE